MRKADYAALAAIIRAEITAASPSTDPGFNRGRVFALRLIACQFAERASVNKTEFLKACGVQS